MATKSHTSIRFGPRALPGTCADSIVVT
jgi:hypothetical protein